MEPEQRGRRARSASRASSTSSLGREVRCGCQYYQSDSLLPERRALLLSRPSSRTMQQPPAVRCRSVSILSARPRVYRRSSMSGPGREGKRNGFATRWFFPSREGDIVHSILRPFAPPTSGSGVGYTAVREPRRAPPRLFKVRPAGYR